MNVLLNGLKAVVGGVLGVAVVYGGLLAAIQAWQVYNPKPDERDVEQLALPGVSISPRTAITTNKGLVLIVVCVEHKGQDRYAWTPIGAGDRLVELTPARGAQEGICYDQRFRFFNVQEMQQASASSTLVDGRNPVHRPRQP